MKISEVLESFVSECSRKLNLVSIVQFGSSTYSQKYNDIDLMLVSANQIAPTKDFLELLKIIKTFEKKNKDVVFDIGGRARKRRSKYKITVLFVDRVWLKIKYHPADLFLLKNLTEDRNKRLLFGKNVFTNKVNLSNQHIYESLQVDFIHAFGQALDDKEKRFEAVHFLFKSYLRYMLVNDYGILEKDKLLGKFRIKFKDKIKLPKNSDKILNKKINNQDFIEILAFAKDCLNYLTRRK